MPHSNKWLLIDGNAKGTYSYREQNDSIVLMPKTVSHVKIANIIHKWTAADEAAATKASA